jgi:RNA polymerase sigma factor (sigma-70 family)
MDDLKVMIESARVGDVNAYGMIVRRFQDMAAGYAYSLLHDFQLAEDAAQEAFVEAYRTLSQLREPAAFRGWLRRIVFKQCDRLTRGKEISAVAIESARGIAGRERDPSTAAEDREMNEAVRRAIEALPESEREITALFYIGEHSQEEIARFLEVPVSTVKNRLHTAREHLRDWIVERVEEDFKAHRPSRNEQFAATVVRLICDGTDPEGNKFAIIS